MQILDVPVGAIARHPHNPRRAAGDVTELAASMRESGLVQPIVVAPFGLATGKKSKFSQYVLIAGERRWTAAKSLKWTDIKAVVRDDLDTEAKQIQAMLVENLQRADLTPIEEADAYTQLAAFDIKPEEIAAATGRSIKTVKARMSLAKLAKPVADKVHAGQISLEAAEKLAAFKGDAKQVERLEKAIGTGNFHYELEKANRENKRAKAVARLQSKATKSAAFKVVKPPPGYNDGRDKGWRDLGGLLRNLPSRQDDGYLDKAIAAHSEIPCDGLVAWCRDYDPFPVVFACTKPENHGQPAAAKAKSAAETPAQRKRREADERRREEDATASAARIGFVREVIAGKAFDLVPLLRCVVINYCLYADVSETTFALLGLEPTANRRGDVALVIELVKGMKSPAAIASVLFALMAESAEPAISSSWDETRSWLDTLQAYGYELSDVDRRLIPAENGEDETDDDAGDQDDVLDRPVTGVCKVCGCTDAEGCEESCAWMDDSCTLCSACAEKAEMDPDVFDDAEPDRDVEDVVPAGELADAI